MKLFSILPVLAVGLFALNSFADSITIHGKIDPSMKITGWVSFVSSNCTTRGSGGKDGMGFGGGKVPESKTVQYTASSQQDGTYELKMDTTMTSLFCKWDPADVAGIEIQMADDPSIEQNIGVQLKTPNPPSSVATQCSPTGIDHTLDCSGFSDDNVSIPANGDLEFDISSQ